MSEELKQLAREKEEAEHKAEVWKHRSERLENRMKYQRNAKDKARTHRLIQYGAVFEHHYKGLADFSDDDVYSLVEQVLEIPEVDRLIRRTIESHEKGGD